MREPAERESEAYEGWATRIVPAYPAVRSSFRAGWFARHDEAPESPFDTASPTPWHERTTSFARKQRARFTSLASCAQNETKRRRKQIASSVY